MGTENREDQVKPVEYSIATRDTLGDNYEYFCVVADLVATEGGWGFLHCVNDDGQRSTAVTNDVPYLELLVAANGIKSLSGLEIPEDKFPIARYGWPDEWVGIVSPKQQGRNKRCSCGSGKKYKQCHGEHAPGT